jgi:hypothetical protein
LCGRARKGNAIDFSALQADGYPKPASAAQPLLQHFRSIFTAKNREMTAIAKAI